MQTTQVPGASRSYRFGVVVALMLLVGGTVKASQIEMYGGAHIEGEAREIWTAGRAIQSVSESWSDTWAPGIHVWHSGSWTASAALTNHGNGGSIVLNTSGTASSNYDATLWNHGALRDPFATAVVGTADFSTQWTVLYAFTTSHNITTVGSFNHVGTWEANSTGLLNVTGSSLNVSMWSRIGRGSPGTTTGSANLTVLWSIPDPQTGIMRFPGQVPVEPLEWSPIQAAEPVHITGYQLAIPVLANDYAQANWVYTSHAIAPPPAAEGVLMAAAGGETRDVRYAAEGSNFKSLLLPVLDDSEPVSFSLLIDQVAYTLNQGEAFDFTELDPAGISQFSILDIETGGEVIDWDIAFTFMSPGAVTVFAVIPEPSTWAMGLMAALGMLLVSARRRNKSGS